jgi:hypothetical protein
METSQQSNPMNTDQLTFSWEAHHAKPSALPDSERDWMTLVATYPSHSLPLLNAYGPSGWSGKTSPASCQLTEEGHLEPSSQGWGKSGMGSPTAFSTLNISEWHSAAAVCLLSDILEIGDLPQRYYLSAKACQGILRRAAKRNKELPAALRDALQLVAHLTEESQEEEPETP